MTPVDPRRAPSRHWSLVLLLFLMVRLEAQAPRLEFLHGMMPPDSGASLCVTLGDVDGDGDLDAFFGNFFDDRLYINDGSGTYSIAASQLPVSAPAAGAWTSAIALGDVDLDGDLDVCIGSTGSVPGSQNRLLLNDGTGTFIDATVLLPAFPDMTSALAFGDIDGDGDLDLLVGNGGPFLSPGEQNRLLVNDGAGTFSEATGQLPAMIDPTSALALGDVDQDGDLDILVGNDGSGQVAANIRLLLNDGVGTFTLGLGDIDGDGDLDAFVGEGGQDRLLINLSRQAAWRGLPRHGKPLTVDLWGSANEPWYLFGSLGPGQTFVPVLGTVRLDLPTLVPLGSGLLDFQGHAGISAQIPPAGSQPLTIFLQGVVGSTPARVTNLEILGFSNL